MAMNPNYALQFQRALAKRTEPKKTRATGTVTAVSADSDGKIKNATISTGSGLLSVPVPYGTNVYTGMTVAVTNDGTPSNAQWRLSGTTSVPGGIQGGSIINHDGNTFAMFDSIWVRNDGTIIVGGDVDIDGDPTGPRVESNQCGYFGYDQYNRQSLAIYAANCDDRYAGDVLLGPEEASRISVLPTDGIIRIENAGRTSLEFSPDGNFVRDPLTIGNPVGARINIGEIEDKATLVMRDKYGVAKLVARTDDTNDIYVHIGNPPPQDNSMWFDSATGLLNVNGHVTMQSMDVRGRATFSSTGEFMIVDPDNSQRYGMITPRGIYAYSVDALGQQYLASVDAWAPLTLETRVGSGVWKTWLAGEMMRGDADYRQFSYERGPTGRLGLFDGNNPVVYVDAQGRGVFGRDDDSIIIDTDDGIQFFNLDAEELEQDNGKMITFWTDPDDPFPTHRIAAYLDTTQTPNQHRLVVQAQPLAGYRASILLSAFGDKQAQARLRAVGGYNTADQQQAYIDVIAYNSEGASSNYSRINLNSHAVKIEPYTSATAFTGTLPDGLLMYTDGTWNPGGLGEGLYIYSNSAWHLIRGPYDASHRWGDATNYAQIDGDGILTFEGVGRIRPRYGNETKTTSFTASTQTYYRVDTTGGAVTVTLPTAVGISGRIYIFKLINGSNALTLDPDGTETIDGATTWTTSTLYGGIAIISNGTNWEIIGVTLSSGGVTDHGALTGLTDDDHTGYLLATGARTGASSQAQTFTNGIIGPSWKPSSNSTTALQMQNAGGTAILTVDTSNSRVVLANGVPVMIGADRFLHRYGTANFFAGTNAGNFSTSGVGNNVGIGNNALVALTDGYYNIGIGSGALEDLTSGVGNVTLASLAGRNITTGSYNFAFGYYTLQAITESSYNVGIGAGVMPNFNPTGSGGGNIGIGASVMDGLTTGTDNVAIGTVAGLSGNGSRRILLGADAGYHETGSNVLIIDSQSRGSEAAQRIGAPLYAEMSTTLTSQLVRVNGVFQSLMNDAATNASTTQVKISHNTSGTVTDGFGSRVLWELESSTATDQTAAAIDGWWVDKTHSSRTGAISVYGSYAGTLEEGVRVDASSDGSRTKIGDAAAGNYSQFDHTGHLTFTGTAKPWDDLRVEPVARSSGTNSPAFEKWFDDAGLAIVTASGTSRGTYLYSFDDAVVASEKELFYNVQYSHAWDGGTVYVHVHWIGSHADTTATPRWGLEYNFKEPGATFGATTTVYATGNHVSDADIVAGKHYITSFSAITPDSTQDGLSSVMTCRIFRNSSNAADTYNVSGNKCGLLYIDAHYQMARFGSSDEYVA